jgi:steroid delta-isomerase-like uncharacterized protein
MATDIEKWVKEEDEAWAAKDVERILSLYADDIVYEDLALEVAHRGKEEVRTFLTGVFVTAPDFRVENRFIIASDERVCIANVLHGTNTGNFEGFPPASGKSFSVRSCHVCELRDGKAFRVTDYYNLVTLMRQMGMTPPAQP